MASKKIDGISIELQAKLDPTGVEAASKKITAVAGKIERQFKGIESSSKEAGTAMGTTKNSAKQAANSYNSLGSKAGRAGIQIQQLTGQVQGGVNPMIALSQQAADLGIVLGAPLLGVIASMGAALAITLLPNAFNAKTALEQLEEITDKLKETMSLSSSGVAEYSDELRKLAKRSESLAKAQIAGNIIDANKQIKIATKDIKESILDLSQGSFQKLNDVIAGSGKSIEDFKNGAKVFDRSAIGMQGNISGPNALEASLRGLMRNLGITRSQAIDLGLAMSTFSNNEGAVGAAALSSALGTIGKEAAFGNEKVTEFTNKITPMSDSIADFTDFVNKSRVSLTDLGGALDEEVNAETFTKMQESTKSLSSQLAVVKAEFEGGAQAARRMAVAQSLGLSVAQLMTTEAGKNLSAIEAIENEKAENAESDAAREKKRKEGVAKLAALELTQRKIEKANGIRINKERIAGELADKKQGILDFAEFMKGIQASEDKEKKVSGEFKDLQSELDPGTNLERLEEKLIAERDLTNLYFALKIEDKFLNDEQLKALEQERDDALTAIAAKGASDRASIVEAEQRAKLSAVSSAFGDLSSLMNTESKKMFEVGKAAALSGALVDGFAAVQGAIKAGNKIGGPPVGAAFGVAAGVQAAVNIKKIAGQKFGSGGSTTSFSGGVPAVNTQGGGAQQNRNISIAGIDSNSLISGGQLVDTLNQALGDGYTINFAGG